MLSIVVNGRNLPAQVNNCLISLVASVAKLRMEEGVEYVLADDASDAGNEIVPQLLAVRQQTRSPVKVLRFKQRQHYSAGLAYTFSAAAGDSILYVSHDMVVTPDYIRTLLAVSALDSSIGVVRGTSQHVDGPHEYRIPMALPARSLPDIFSFSAYVAEYHGLAWAEDKFLTGDSMLIKSSVLQKVGIFDRRYFSYFGDIDFGLRVQRAGFKLVCAKGAWLLHEGAAYYKQQRTEDKAGVHKARMEMVAKAYGLFREKWDQTLPAGYVTTDQIDFARLRNVPPLPQEGEFQPKLALDSAVVEQL